MCHHMTLEEWQLLAREAARRRGAAHDRGQRRLGAQGRTRAGARARGLIRVLNHASRRAFVRRLRSTYFPQAQAAFDVDDVRDFDGRARARGRCVLRRCGAVRDPADRGDRARHPPLRASPALVRVVEPGACADPRDRPDRLARRDRRLAALDADCIRPALPAACGRAGAAGRPRLALAVDSVAFDDRRALAGLGAARPSTLLETLEVGLDGGVVAPDLLGRRLDEAFGSQVMTTWIRVRSSPRLSNRTSPAFSLPSIDRHAM